MLRTARMRKVRILALEKDIDRITEVLGRLEMLQLIDINQKKKLSPLLQSHDERERIRSYHQFNDTLAQIMLQLEIHIPQSIADGTEESEQHYTDEEVQTIIARVGQELKPVLEQEDKLKNQLQSLQHSQTELGVFAPLGVGVDQLNHLSFMHFAIGTMPEERIPDVTDELGNRAVIIPYQKVDNANTRVVLITGRRGRFALETALEKAGFESQPIPDNVVGIPNEMIDALNEEITKLKPSLDRVNEQKRLIRERYQDILLHLRRFTQVEEKVHVAMEKFARTETAYILSGWLPEQLLNKFNEVINRVTRGRSVVEIIDPTMSEELSSVPDDSVPVLLQNPRFLKPFELLVTNYGLPQYRELEPTILAAIGFLLMFGIMFGDVGQGAVLFIVGVLLYRSREERMRGFNEIGYIIAAGGVMAMLSGLFYGSVFGNEEIIPPMWIKPSENPMVFLGLTVVLGMFFISVALIFSIINNYRMKHYHELFFGEHGIPGLWFYWGFLFLLSLVVFQRAELINSVLVIALTIVPLVVIFLGDILYNFATNAKHIMPEEPVTYMLQQVIKMLEVITGFISNTISFVRLGAFTLAHIYLGIVVYMIADMLHSLPSGALLSVLMIIIGNILIIVLEGLIVTIQTLRLEYYELFSKFMSGQGRAFDPFKV